MLKRLILVVLYAASLVGKSEQAVLSCDVKTATSDTVEMTVNDLRVTKGYPRLNRDDPIFIGDYRQLSVMNTGDSPEEEVLGVCFSTAGLGCHKQNNDEEDCDNYIRGVTFLKPCTGSPCPVLVCGTNSLLPRCTICNYTLGSSQVSCDFKQNKPPQNSTYNGEDYSSCSAENIDGEEVFAFRKNQNATFLHVQDNDMIYYGLVRERSDTRSIVGLASINNETGVITRRVTTRLDSEKMVATEAHFVGIPFISDDFVYFLFREPAQEFASLTEGQQYKVETYYSRIARICMDDPGTAVSSALILTSFLKQRLVCQDKNAEIVYNEIQDFVYSNEGMIIHAIFTNEQNASPMSALCVFNLTEIDDTFDSGNFFGADGGVTNDRWREYDGPLIDPRPGLNCSNPNTGDTNFERDYNLMNDWAEQKLSVFLEGDRFSNLEMYSQDNTETYMYLIASEKGCLYQVNVSVDSTEEIDLGNPCKKPVVSSPIKDLELASGDSYLLTSGDIVTILDECIVNKRDSGSGDCLSPPAGTYKVRPNSAFEFIFDWNCTGWPNITINGMPIEDYYVLKRESLDTSDALVQMSILILYDTLVAFPIGNLNYMIEICNNYTTGELTQRCDEWDEANKAFTYLNGECKSATNNMPGTFSSQMLLDWNQVQSCENCAYNGCTESCPP